MVGAHVLSTGSHFFSQALEKSLSGTGAPFFTPKSLNMLKLSKEEPTMLRNT